MRNAAGDRRGNTCSCNVASQLYWLCLSIYYSQAGDFDRDGFSRCLNSLCMVVYGIGRIRQEVVVNQRVTRYLMICRLAPLIWRCPWSKMTGIAALVWSLLATRDSIEFSPTCPWHQRLARFPGLLISFRWIELANTFYWKSPLAIFVQTLLVM